MDDDHDLVADINSDTLIRIVKFLKRGEAPGPDNIHNEGLRLGTTTSMFHTSFYLLCKNRLHPTCMEISYPSYVTEPDKLPSLTTSYRPVSLTSLIMKLFERVIEQRLHFYLGNIRFINKYQLGF